MATDVASYLPGQIPLPSAPVDSAGGVPGSYATQVFDLFKFGIGAATSLKVAELTAPNTSTPVQTANGRTSVAGQASGNVANGISVAGMSTTTMLLIGGGLLIGLIVLKKVL